MGLNIQLFAKLIIIIGILFVVIGGILLFFKDIPFLGKLPGDIHIQRKNFSFHFPIVTCVLISVILSIILYIFGRK